MICYGNLRKLIQKDGQWADKIKALRISIRNLEFYLSLKRKERKGKVGTKDEALLED